MDNDFFDKNVNRYAAKKARSYDVYFINFIRKQNKRKISLLDVGGGSGLFARLVREKCPNATITVVDPSKEMLNKINDEDTITICGKLPNQLSLDSKFGYIHVKEVFHHITGSSVCESKKLLKESLFSLKNLMEEDGFLMIHELFYESYIIPRLSRTLIFYLLTLQNKIRVKIPSYEFLINLNACFYTRSEFSSILNDCGFKIIHSREDRWADIFKKRALLLKDWGRMLFIAKKI